MGKLLGGSANGDVGHAQDAGPGPICWSEVHNDHVFYEIIMVPFSFVIKIALPH